MLALSYILDCLVDGAQEEYRDINLSSVDSVQQYVENALDDYISKEDARLVLDTARALLSYEKKGYIISRHEHFLLNNMLDFHENIVDNNCDISTLKEWTNYIDRNNFKQL